MRRFVDRFPPAARRVRQVSLMLIAALALGVAVQGVAQAEWNGGGGGWHGGGGNWNGGGGWLGGGGGWHGNVGAWHGGSWYHGWHGGVFGWWWAVPGYDWYAFDAPIYPYPPYPGAPPPVAGPLSPGAGFWYYCPSPAGYYPYVQQCAGPWQPVPPQGG
jgi:hypothetical protein